MKTEVYISSCLSEVKDSSGNLYGKKVYDALYKQTSITLKEIKTHQENIYCREFMPVKTGKGNRVQFVYAPAYMTISEEKSKKCPKPYEISRELNIEGRMCHMILNGCAVEVSGEKAIVSNSVFMDNLRSKSQLQDAFKYMQWSEDEKMMMVEILPKDEESLVKQLKDALQINELICVPQYPFDVTRNIEGVVRFVNEDVVIINAIKDLYTDESSKERIQVWYKEFSSVIENAGLKIVELPFVVPVNEKSLTGNYLNFLKFDHKILMPGFNLSEDQIVKNKLEELFHLPVEIIDVVELSQEGGSLNSIAWVG